MPESTMFSDLMAAQGEMPHFQKTALNPFFKSKYIPLEDILPTVLEILHKHNFILLQTPSVIDGAPALGYRLWHESGESISDTMLLCGDLTPQGQGAAVTYARRYSLMALLGLTADVDDDAEATRAAPKSQDIRPRSNVGGGVMPASSGYPAPECPQGHGLMKLWPARDETATAKAMSAVYKCQNRDCKDSGGKWPESIWENKWIVQVNMSRGGGESFASSVDPNDLPFE